MTFIIIAGFALYAYACALFYKDVHRHTMRILSKTKRLAVRTFAIIIMILFPSWDFLIGHSLYFVICKMNVHYQVYSEPFISSVYVESDNGFILNSDTLKEILKNKNMRFIEADVRSNMRGIDIKRLGRYKFFLEDGQLKYERIYLIRSNYRIRFSWRKYRFLNVTVTRYTLYSRDEEMRIAEASDVFIGMKIPAPLFNWVLDIDREMKNKYVRSCKKNQTNSMSLIHWLATK